MTVASDDAVWPRDKLEQLNHCPVCGSTDRSILFEDLADDSFRVAPGKWSLWKCTECSNAYLDPRPDRSAIGAAYARYYTHEEAPLAPLASRWAKFRQAIGNGYRNTRFGLDLKPALRAGSFITRLLPGARRRIDVQYRFIGRPGGGRCSVLDVGCGNGSWLELAREAGWIAQGVEPDAISALRAKQRGLDVRRSLNEFLSEPERFQHITMNHVIEHVHDPVETLEACLRLLEPAGVLYIETPNIDALGLKNYGRFWRGLEAPRHLVLFSIGGLTDLLERVGFIDIAVHSLPDVRIPLAMASERMMRGRLPDDESAPVGTLRTGFLDRVRVAMGQSRAEFISLTCRRPR